MNLVCAALLPREARLAPTSQLNHTTLPSTPQRVAWAVLIIATLYICYFSHLDVIGFVGPDEPRYAWIARDMAESGDWITPRLYGKPWFEKPPLLYWGGALFFKLLGEGRPEIAARLPSAISALLATLALAWLAWRTYGEECARWLLLLLPTSVGMIGFSHACATDMPFAGMLTIAMVCAAVVLGVTPPTENTPILPRTPWVALLLFGFFLGLAALAKGPAGIILIGGAVFFWSLFTKRWRDAFRLLHPAAIAAFCVTALPWYVLCARRNPDFFRIFIIEHNFKRYLTPEFQHIQPFWYYIPVLLIAFLPWTAASLYAATSGAIQIYRTRKLGSLACLALVLSLWTLVFFSVSRSKLPGYILPAVPFAGLLCAQFLSSTAADPNRRKSVGYALFLFTAFCFVGASVLDRTGRLPLIEVAFLLSIVALVNICLGSGFRDRAKSSARNLALAIAVLVFLIAVGTLDFGMYSGEDLSTNLVAVHLNTHGVPTDDLVLSGQVPRGLRYSLNFYLRREVEDWDENPKRPVYVLSRTEDCLRLNNRGFECQYLDLGSTVHRWYLSRIQPNSLPRAGSRRQPQQKE